MNPNLQQMLHMVVAKNWVGVIDAASDYTNGDVKQTLTTAGDVAFVVNSNKEGRFVFKDNDGIKMSNLLSKSDLFSMIDAYRTDPKNAAGTAALTKFHQKVTAIKLVSPYNTSSGVESNDVASVTVHLRHYLVLGEDNVYLKQGFCQVREGMTAKEIIITLAKSLADNMKRDANLGFEVCVGPSSAATPLPTVANQKITFAQLKSMKLSDLLQITTALTDALIIYETYNDWELGRYNFSRPEFDVTYSTLQVGGGSSGSLVTEVDNWAELVNYQVENGGMVNGYAFADLEYFCQANRGNMNRKMFFPYSNFTQPLIDPTLEYESLVIDSHYEGDAEDIQKSPVQLYVVAKKSGATGAGWTATIAGIVSAIESALELTAPASGGEGGNG